MADPRLAGALLAGSPFAGFPGAAAPAGSRRTTRAWGLLLLVLGVVSLGVRGFVLHRLQAGVLTVWQVIWLTLPVVAAAAFLVYRWRAAGRIAVGGLIGIVVGTVGTSYLTGISSGGKVANSLFQFDANCLLHNTCTAPAAAASPLSVVLRVVNTYWHVYGTSGFVSAIVIGAVIGLALAMLFGGGRSAGLARLARR